MNVTRPGSPPVERNLYSVCLIMAPLLFGISTLFWNDGKYGVTGGTILILSFIFWIPSMMLLFGMLKPAMPRIASAGMLIAIAGCIAGINFGFADVLTAVFGISHEDYLAGFAKYPVVANLLLFSTGPLFPLSFLALSIAFLVKKTIPVWASVFLGLGSILFPFSRILRTEMLAHWVDLFFLVPLTWMAFNLHLEKTTGLS